LNSNIGLKNYCQKLVKTLFNCTNFKNNFTLLTKPENCTNAALQKRSGAKAGYTFITQLK